MILVHVTLVQEICSLRKKPVKPKLAMRHCLSRFYNSNSSLRNSRLEKEDNSKRLSFKRTPPGVNASPFSTNLYNCDNRRVFLTIGRQKRVGIYRLDAGTVFAAMLAVKTEEEVILYQRPPVLDMHLLPSGPTWQTSCPNCIVLNSGGAQRNSVVQ